MSSESPQPLITEVPGAEPFTGNLPDSRRVPIPADQVTPQMYNHAIGSPYRNNAMTPEMAPRSREQEAAELVGDVVASNFIEVDQESVENPPAGL